MSPLRADAAKIARTRLQHSGTIAKTAAGTIAKKQAPTGFDRVGAYAASGGATAPKVAMDLPARL